MFYQIRKKLKILMLTRMACEGFYLMSIYFPCLKSLMLKRMACDGFYPMNIYMPCLKIFCSLNNIGYFVNKSGEILKFVLTGERESV